MDANAMIEGLDKRSSTRIFEAQRVQVCDYKTNKCRKTGIYFLRFSTFRNWNLLILN